MATARASSMVMALIMVAGLQQIASAVRQTLTWEFANNATEFSEWAARQNFQVGDEIAFVYDAPNHDVLEVTQANLDSCISDSPINSYTESNKVVTLDRSGYFGFICGVPSHCSPGNMTMNVNVSPLSPSASPVAPVTAPTPSSPPSATPPSSPSVSPSAPPPTRTAPATAPVSDASSLQTRSAIAVGVLVAACAAILL